MIETDLGPMFGTQVPVSQEHCYFHLSKIIKNSSVIIAINPNLLF